VVQKPAGVFVSKVAWEGSTLKVYPTGVGRYSPIGGGSAWQEVIRRAPRANTPAMFDQFFCHWDFVRIRQHRKESWNLDASRPDGTYWDTVANNCNIN